MTDIVDRLKACETRSLVTMSEETGQLVRSSESWVELWRCLQDAAAEIERLRLTDEEREAILAMACHCDTRAGLEWHKYSATLRLLLERMKCQ